MSTPDLTKLLLELAGFSSMPSCCSRESHEALKLSDTWVTLQYVGIQETGLEYSLELRNCKCGSTLAKKIPLDLPKAA